jgi:YesN/AraC family two-component response regulator
MASGSLRVLLVDDEPLIRAFMKSALLRCGYAVTDAEDGLVAWELAQADDFDVLVTDIRMPGMDGIELARRVQETLPHVRLLFISGFIDAPAAGIPVERFLRKPFQPQELVTKLAKVVALSRPEDRGAAVARVPGTRVRPSTKGSQRHQARPRRKSA